mgnify:FL=1
MDLGGEELGGGEGAISVDGGERVKVHRREGSLFSSVISFRVQRGRAERRTFGAPVATEVLRESLRDSFLPNITRLSSSYAPSTPFQISSSSFPGSLAVVDNAASDRKSVV